jgi:hypothetical protein
MQCTSQVENALLEYKQEGVRSEIKFSLECMGPRLELLFFIALTLLDLMTAMRTT